ncbi:hypothetical protein GGS20DRAFT_556610 [Poronia punctata]|nr:hypothetical protein GGS20DRAFT_556610 [Poronia punctata]
MFEEKFLHVRMARISGWLVDSGGGGAGWWVYVYDYEQGQLGKFNINIDEKKGRGMMIINGPTTTTTTEKEKEKGREAIKQLARKIIGEITSCHETLFGHDDHLRDILSYLSRAREAEKVVLEQLPTLLTKDDENALEKEWTPRCAKSLERLEMRMHELRELGRQLRGSVMWLQQQGQRREDSDLDLNVAGEIVKVWGTVLMDIQEGFLFRFRREEVEREKMRSEDGGVDYDASWERWKGRNCGGTSCYEEAGILSGVKGVFLSGLKTAQVARDEAVWSRKREGKEKFRIWKGVYEKACCCEDGLLAKLLRFGSAPSDGNK